MTDASAPVRATIRPGEVTVDVPAQSDARLIFIGRIHTPWAQSRECPRAGDAVDGPVCRIDIDAPWQGALDGLERNSHVQVLYFMHLARRDLLRQSPRSDGTTTGTFALRSPNRPNPIAVSVCALVEVGEGYLLVRGLDCVDGTPLLDLKPIKCPEAPRPKA